MILPLTSLPLVSVVFISYNRTELLKRTLDAFRKHCTYTNLELILSDDGSSKSEREARFQMGFDRLIFAGSNEGMGANINKGIQAAGGEYIMHLEDDWICQERTDFIEQAVEIMEANHDIGYVKFNPSNLPVYDVRKGPRGQSIRVISNQQPDSAHSIYVYSNNPHLKRKSFHHSVGWFIEGQPVGITEDNFCRLFLTQTNVRVATVEGWHLFKHMDTEPSTRPDRWRQNIRLRIRKRTITRPLVAVYDSLPLNIKKTLFWRKTKTKRDN